MTAQGAYNLVVSAKTQKAENQLKEIKAQIKKAVENDELETGYSGPICPNIKRILERDGYRVVTFSGRMNETENTISWDLTPKE